MKMLQNFLLFVIYVFLMKIQDSVYFNSPWVSEVIRFLILNCKLIAFRLWSPSVWGVHSPTSTVLPGMDPFISCHRTGFKVASISACASRIIYWYDRLLHMKIDMLWCTANDQEMLKVHEKTWYLLYEDHPIKNSVVLLCNARKSAHPRTCLSGTRQLEHGRFGVPPQHW